MTTRSLLFTFLIFVIAAAAAMPAAAQRGADNRPMPRFPDSTERPLVEEAIRKLRIERDKKAFNETLDRGAEALRLAEEVESSFAAGGQLTKADREKINAVEKIARKIRSDLGGGEDDKADDDTPAPQNTAEGVAALKSAAAALHDELKRTTRFSVSAPAIFSTNAVIRATRFLKSSR